MTISELVALRLKHKIPLSVWIVAGDKPRIDISGRIDVIHIGPRDDVARMDLRALIDVHVDVFENSDDDDFLDAVAKAVDAAKPKSTGLASSRTLVEGLNHEHEAVLSRAWELLCNS